MKIGLNLMGTKISVCFSGETKDVTHFYRFFFREFMTEVDRADAPLRVSFLPDSVKVFPFSPQGRITDREMVVPNHEIAGWLGKLESLPGDFPFSEQTMSSLLFNGLLLYSPETAAGQIYLLRHDPYPFRPLHHLFWIYFAQVLGERGSCFLHAAALVKGERGYLFLGESGAGKSTLSRSCIDCQVFSDDGPMVCGHGSDLRVYPSPFYQLDRLEGLNIDDIGQSARVCGFYFLIQDQRSFLEPVDKRVAFSLILKRHIHFFPSLSRKARERLFFIFLDACAKITTHNLHFSKDQDIWDILMEEKEVLI